MKNLSFRFLFPLLTMGILIVILNMPVGQLPALGRFFNPYIGVIQNENETLESKSLFLENRDFSIYFDEDRIPHVLSVNEDDMHFGQGYVTASDRLWQMDFMSYASAGRLSEVLGENLLSYDRVQRRYGMLSSAKKTLKFIESNSLTKDALDNYTAGVNAYIESLDEGSIPLEYKILGYKPEPWTNLKSVLIMKYVGAMLTGYEEDISSSYMLAALGKEDYFKLYPDYVFGANGDIPSIEVLMSNLPCDEYIDYSFLFKAPRITQSEFNPRLGSNAWAISSEKSESGNAILSNDPHLSLTYPSIWYEIQLKSNERNVYGFSIPGTPGVIIGFNENISWGITNGATDVRDWYKLELKENYSAYLFDGKWKPTKSIIEKIKIKDHDTFYDTVYYSVHGPIVVSGSYEETPIVRDYAMKWSLHNSSNEFLAILNLNKASNQVDFEKSIGDFKFPIQNFVYADSKGNIAYHHQGAILKKSKKGEGRFILDGTKRKNLLNTELERDQLPKIINPESHYVYSANNNPWDTTFGNYVNGYYAELRADKIQDFLKGDDQLSVSDMKSMQLDNTNRLAELAIPELLKTMGESDSKFKSRLAKWNFKYEKNSDLALFFERWWNLIEFHTWDEIYRYDQYLRYPDDLILLELIKKEPKSKFFDEQNTNKKEGAKAIILKAFKEAMHDYKSSKARSWKDSNKVNILHLTNMTVFSKMGFSSAGHPNALNAISENWGPSMRMIVEMGDKPKAIGIMAGGTSGNPASNYYDNFIASWLKGEYHEMILFYSHEEAKKKTSIIWTSN